MKTIWKRELEKLLGRNRIKENELVSSHTVTQIGGAALFYLEVDSIEELIKTVSLARTLELPVLVFGTGYGEVVQDLGFDGLVIKNLCRKYEMANVSGKIVHGKMMVGKAYLYAESGTLFTQLVRFSLDKNYSGLENFLGFSGTVGEVVRRQSWGELSNSYVADSLKSLTILTNNGEIKEIEPEELITHKDAIILEVVLTIYPGDHTTIWEKANEASLYYSTIQEEGQVIGRVFRDISQADAMRIPTPAHTKNATYLLDNAGVKGKKIGGVKVSSINSNYILNTGNATARDVGALIDFMKKEVYDTFRVQLVSEIQIH